MVTGTLSPREGQRGGGREEEGEKKRRERRRGGREEGRSEGKRWEGEEGGKREGKEGGGESGEGRREEQWSKAHEHLLVCRFCPECLATFLTTQLRTVTTDHQVY